MITWSAKREITLLRKILSGVADLTQLLLRDLAIQLSFITKFLSIMSFCLCRVFKSVPIATKSSWNSSSTAPLVPLWDFIPLSRISVFTASGPTNTIRGQGFGSVSSRKAPTHVKLSGRKDANREPNTGHQCRDLSFESTSHFPGIPLS